MADNELIPRTVLFGNPERVAPKISPDGTRLAWIAPRDGVLNVWVATIGADDARVVTDDRDRGVRAYFWAPDDERILYLQDQAGDENWRLYDTHLAGGETRDLTPFDGVQAQVQAIDLDVRDRILVGLNKDDQRLHDMYQLDLAEGGLTKVVPNPGVVAFVNDSDLNVRAGVMPRPDGGMTVLLHERGDWQPLLEIPQVDSLTSRPIAFDSVGGRLLMVSSVDANAAQLVWIDVATGATEVVAADPDYDVAAVWLERRTYRPLLAAFQRERMVWQAIDEGADGVSRREALEAELAALAGLDPGDLTVLSRDRADRTWIVGYNHADGPVRYYAFDRVTRRGEFLFENQPALSEYSLGEVEPFSFVARDGLTVHGYLTYPPGGPPGGTAGGPAGIERQGLPAVLNVHGGPWARDVWGLHPEAQWLANRGYLCVQVNFRGSTGYGKTFANAGDREWGGRMHDDLVDAVAFLTGRGLIDPERVAIYGGSYGGYAALVGATFTPDLFRCAVDIVGPSNLKTLIESIPPYWEPLIAEFHLRVGNPSTEPEFMWSRSPLSRVDAIKIPLLIAQGANDPRVKQAESEQIVAALREKGIPHEYMLFPDEGHGFAKPENRLRFYAAAEKFLATHLGGRFEP
jgi:dipeptidyl aminopeptidase/acylaminoacyl peptidase